MRKNDKKQRRSLLFSTAVVVTGCLLTAFYVNQEMPKSEYEVDLSQLSAEQKQEDLAGDMRTGDAGVAKVTGNDVQNPVIAAETDAEKNTAKDGKQEVTKPQDGGKQQTSSDKDQAEQQTSQSGQIQRKRRNSRIMKRISCSRKVMQMSSRKIQAGSRAVWQKKVQKRLLRF